MLQQLDILSSHTRVGDREDKKKAFQGWLGVYTSENKISVDSSIRPEDEVRPAWLALDAMSKVRSQAQRVGGVLRKVRHIYKIRGDF